MSNKQYIVSYDIAEPKRLRKIASIMEGYGYRIQYSVFLCYLTPVKLEHLKTDILSIINHNEDQCLIIDIGPGNEMPASITSLGKPIPKIPQLTIF
ncbi:MAG TPA: CRISPR-associated endonuclease Cas2 [Victivallales bacterium]|nr:CRISPR-associated endonuclease Cas2 [Victivallales bacterium]HRR29467.1 CRISPR-associated endonuclease Cas2 [Victivallales bacterium]